MTVHIVQKVFLTRPTVKHTRSSADTDKSVRRVYVRDSRLCHKIGLFEVKYLVPYLI